jgi:hypothetical protein
MEATWQAQKTSSTLGDPLEREMNIIWCSMEMTGPDIYEAALK